MSSGPELFKTEALSLDGHLPELSDIVLGDDPVFLIGTLTLLDEKGELIDSYRIKIAPTGAYPNAFPLVYEINGRLPHNIDWHIYSDGHFCIKAWPEELLICNNGISLQQFIKEQILPYLFGQKFREVHGYFLNERSHGSEGNIEFFKDVFNTSDLNKIRQHLEFISRKEKPNRVAKCFCGSGLKYRKCHRKAYQLLSNLSDAYLSLYIRMIESALC
ncbi:MAG: hypothetical protein EOO61_05140 [Hymenobacter sp.]|nr:MAG: hypothetical protein EOO61_05140 [Hymenobacter sp.]